MADQPQSQETQVFEINDAEESTPFPEVEQTTTEGGLGVKAGAAATPPAAPAPAAHKHLTWLARKAQNYGLTQAEIDSTPPEQLDHLIYHLDQQREQLSRQVANPSVVNVNPNVIQAEPEEEVDLGLSQEDLEELNPTLVKALKAAAKAPLKKAKEIEKRLKEQAEAESRRTAQSELSFINSKFDSKPELFGNTQRLLPGSDELARREAAYQVFVTATGSLEDRYAKVERLFGVPAAAAKPAERPRVTDDQWAQGGLSRPTDRSRALAPGREKATATLKAKLAELETANGRDETLEDMFG